MSPSWNGATLIVLSLVLAVTGAGLQGCRKKTGARKAVVQDKQEAVSRRAPETQPEPEPVEPEPAPSVVVATVGSVEITKDELEARFQRLTRGRTLPEERLAGYRDRSLDLLIEEARIQVEAENLGIVITDQDVDAAVDKYTEEKGGPQAFEDFLKQVGLTPDEYRDNVRRSLRREALRTRMFPFEVTEEQIAAYFDKHFASARKPAVQQEPRVKVASVTVKLSLEATQEEKDSALARLTEVRREIDAGLDFAEAARKYSQDGYARRGGTNIWASRHVRPVELYAPAFKMKPGDLHGPFLTPKGAHIIKLVEVEAPEEVGTLDSRRDGIRRILEQQGIRRAETEMKKALKKIPAKRLL